MLVINDSKYENSKKVVDSDIFRLVDCIEVRSISADDLTAFLSLLGNSDTCGDKELLLHSLYNIGDASADVLGLVVPRLKYFEMFRYQAHLNSIFNSIATSTELVLQSIMFIDILFDGDEDCDPELMAKGLSRVTEVSLYNCYFLPVTDFLSKFVTALINCPDKSLIDLWLPYGSPLVIGADIICKALSKFKIFIYDEDLSSYSSEGPSLEEILILDEEIHEGDAIPEDGD